MHRPAVLRRALLVLLGALLYSAPLPAQSDPVYIIPIQGEINQSLMVFLSRSVEAARDAEASHIIFDIDTFGGRVDSALQITTIIGSLTDITTVAYVPVRSEGTGVSWSAGALISFACDAIYMAPGTSMGSAAPVLAGADGTSVQADEKTVSAIRTQMAALAEKNGYPAAIARAMVDADVEIVELIVDGQSSVVELDQADSRTAEFEAAGSEVSRGATISEAGKLLSLTAGEMERYGVSAGSVSSEGALFEAMGVTRDQVIRLEPSGADQLVSIVTGAGLTSLLILLGILALFAEITSPGFGVPGAIGILCFAIIFVTNGLLGRVGSVELLLFLVGTVLLVLEVFVIPGFGIAGIGGIALIAISLILSLQTFVIPSFEWEWQRFHLNVLVVVGNILGALVSLGVIAHFFPRVKLFSRLVLAEAQDASAGFQAQVETDRELVGASGTVTSTLRPAGKAEIEGDIVVVESDGEFLEPGTRITVVSASGNRVLVRRTE